MVISKKTIHDGSFSSCPLTISSIKVWNAETLWDMLLKLDQDVSSNTLKTEML